MSTGKKVFLIILIIVIIIAIIAAVIYFWPKGSGNMTGGAPGAPCVPYTQAQYQGEVGKCQNKCSPKLLIPFVGLLNYKACVDTCKGSIPPVVICP